MERFVMQLPWLAVWVVVLILQERMIRKKNWLGSLLLLWVTLLLSFFWDRLVHIFAPETGTQYLYGGRFWILFLIAAAIHVVSRRRDRKETADQKKEEQKAQALENPEENQETEE